MTDLEVKAGGKADIEKYRMLEEDEIEQFIKTDVFSNRITKQTALRDCRASNIYYDLDTVDNKQKKEAFRKRYQRTITAVKACLQYAFLKSRFKCLGIMCLCGSSIKSIKYIICYYSLSNIKINTPF